jgi:hypothetical protein
MAQRSLNQINPVIGQGRQIVQLPMEQTIPVIFMLGITIFLIQFNLIVALLTFGAMMAFWLALTGKDPRPFYQRWRTPRRFLSAQPGLEFNQAGIPMPEKVPEHTWLTLQGKRVKMSNVEANYRFLTYLDFELDGYKVGAHLLQRKQELMLIYMWEAQGHDPSMTAEQSETLHHNINQALINKPQGVDIKIYDDVVCSDAEYQRQQQELLDQSERNDVEKILITSRRKRAHDSASKGLMLSKSIKILAKHRIPLGAKTSFKRTAIEKFLAWISLAFGGTPEVSPLVWEKTLKVSFREAFLSMHSVLTSNTGFGLNVHPMNFLEIAAFDWSQLHAGPPPTDVNCYMILDEDGLRLPVINSHISPLAAIYSAEKGYAAEPTSDRSVLYFPAKDKYAGFVRVGRLRSYPTYSKSEELGQMLYLWKIQTRNGKPFKDCRFIVELTCDESGFEIHSMDGIIQQTQHRQSRAIRNNTINVPAQLEQEAALEARVAAQNNNAFYWCSLGVWLYRDSIEELDADLSDLVRRIAVDNVERVIDCCDDYWLQSMPFEWEAFLTKPHHYRQKYLSQQVIGQIPLINPRGINDRGILYITRELNSSIYIDYAKKLNHTLFIATTGSGKSVNLLEMMLENLFALNLVVAFDFPRPDGGSTYKDTVEELRQLGFKAAYYDVRRQIKNLVELPYIPEYLDERSQRQADVIDGHIRLMQVLILGTKPKPETEQIVTTWLTRAYNAFHQQPEISARYATATAAGWGNPGYDQMPILEDFVNFAAKWFTRQLHDDEEIVTSLTREAIDLIITQLRGQLETPLGRSLNGASTFDPNVDFLVVALTNVSENAASLVYALSGLNALVQKAVTSLRSFCVVDEGTILFNFPAFARYIATFPPNGRKWGLNFVLAAQAVGKIFHSECGEDILKNIDNIFCGRIKEDAKRDMVNLLGFREEILRNYVTDGSRASGQDVQSYWYLKRDDQHVELLHRTGDAIVFIGATEPEEVEARERCKKKFGDQWLLKGSILYGEARRNGYPMSTICLDVKLDEPFCHEVEEAESHHYVGC